MLEFSKPLREGYDFNTKEFLVEGWEMFRSEFWSFVGISLLYIAVLIALALIPYLKHSIVYVQYLLLGGYTVYCRKLLTNEHKKSDFLGGFKHYIQLLFFVITVTFINYVPFLFLFSIYLPYEEVISLLFNDSMLSAFELAITENSFQLIMVFLAFFGFTFWISISYGFVLPLIVDAKMGFWQAMELSRKVIAKRFLSMSAINILMIGASVIIFFVTLSLGLLVALPVYSCVWFVMYLHVFEVRAKQDIDKFEDFGLQVIDINTESQEKELGL